MIQKVLRVAGGLTALLVIGLAALVANAYRVTERSYAHVPEPPLTAKTDPASLARGEYLFRQLCMECHAPAGGDRPTGQVLTELPPFLGTFRSANLAAPGTGVRSRTDGQLARVLRHSVRPDGKITGIMNFRKLADEDVEAILGFLRTDPMFEPYGEPQPPSEPSLAGRLILTYVSGVDVGGPSSGIHVPPKGPTVEYGRYVATQAMDCVVCHTPGFSADKASHPEAFAGGFEFADPAGVPIFSKNITPDPETGIGRWSFEQFERAVRHGVTPDGFTVRKPMPLFSRMDDVEVRAVWEFLRTVPPVRRENRHGGSALEKTAPDDPPEALFVKVGCVACHGETAPHRDRIRPAAGKSDEEIAAWIRDPQAIRPGSAMPSFDEALTPDQALSLARWVKTLAASREPRSVAAAPAGDAVERGGARPSSAASRDR